jgi:general secretion pathway protein D
MGTKEDLEAGDSVKRMVLSGQPETTLEAAGDAALTRISMRAGFGRRRSFLSCVRGHLERVAGMQSNRLGVFFKTFSVRRRGVARVSCSVTLPKRIAKSKCGVPRSVAALLSLMLLGGVAMQATTAHAQSASSWNKRGQTAEAREDFDAAFEAYRQAHLKSPRDLRYKERYERLRFQAANTHLDRGRVLRNSGDLGGAINEFARALQIDPGNQAAAQELQISERPSAAPEAASGGATDGGAAAGSVGGVVVPGLDEQTPYQKQVQKEISEMAGPVQLQPVSNDPITLHAVEDTKTIYQAIGKAAGLNVIFDPDYTSKRIPVDLMSVSLPDALRIVGVLSGTFWKPVTSNTIFVAQNNRAKRTDLDDLAVQTFYLTNVSQQNDANEILVAIRNLLDPSIKVFLVTSQNAIILRATPDELILAEKLINDLDRTRAEVVVDVAVLEVSRQKERDLGITLPTSFGLTPQASNANTTTASTGTTPTTGTPATATTTGITLNTLGNLNATNFAVSITGGTVNALLSDSDTRILQNPRVRATDGQRATLKIGSKIPVATGSSTSTLTTTALATTQFTYLDVGVNIEITPTVHYDREVSLKLKIEISSQTSSVTIESVTEPVISQRVVEQVIQLKDGEPSILAGLIQQQDQNNVSGTPGLGELPFLKYFFSSRDKVQQSDEIVFLMIPHIVRESIVTDDNTRKIYTGTSGSVELIHRDPPPMLATSGRALNSGMSPVMQQTSAANGANAMLGKMAADARPVQPGAIADGMVPGATAGANAKPPVTLTVVPGTANQAIGSTFQVAVMASNAHDLFAAPMQLQFDPKVLTLVNVDSGEMFNRDMQVASLVHRDEGNGAVTMSLTRSPGSKGVDGQGTLCTLTFKAIGPGDSTVALTRVGLKDSQQNPVASLPSQALVHVK